MYEIRLNGIKVEEDADFLTSVKLFDTTVAQAYKSKSPGQVVEVVLLDVEHQTTVLHETVRD